MFPSLPGDPPLPELFGMLALLGLSLSILISIAHRRVAWLGAAVWSLVLLVASVPIAARNVGRWADLKRSPSSFDTAVRAYEAAHGPIDSQDKAVSFYRQYGDREFAFSSDPNERVSLVYLWWHRPGRVGVVWGKGGTAAFDLSTMICVYSD